jgi:pyrroloquinoline-quinone synthase
MTHDAFRESLLQVMESKTHWAWPAFTSGRVAPDRLHIHLEQEYAVYVRDFPVLVGRAYVQCPIPAVRRDLAENLYEEETGGIAAGKPHPVLFLEYPRGLGMDLGRFDDVALLPAARAYRAWLDTATQARGWAVATAIVTLWIEGNAHERSLFDPKVPPRPEPRLEDHPLVKHYGLDIAHLALTKAHRAVEGDHRIAAWRMILDHTPPDQCEAVVQAMEEARALWCAYRDDVAAACGLDRA